MKFNLLTNKELFIIMLEYLKRYSKKYDLTVYLTDENWISLSLVKYNNVCDAEIRIYNGESLFEIGTYGAPLELFKNDVTPQYLIKNLYADRISTYESENILNKHLKSSGGERFEKELEEIYRECFMTNSSVIFDQL